MTTKYGIPCIKLPGGQRIQLGRAIRFVAGIAIILALLAGWIEAHDKVELGIWVGLSLILIDPTLFTTAMTAAIEAWKGKK
ncbi:hypothetical protein LCGC14_0757630 [marine sediment metagenome]|uniref:Uncharacterized protein n=1 Tax=marine sediment metagenome TaxID=412755 RepID=A0A0F9T940_9ZZZZ